MTLTLACTLTILGTIAGFALGYVTRELMARNEAEAEDIQEPEQAVTIYNITIPESADCDIHFPNSEGHL